MRKWVLFFLVLLAGSCAAINVGTSDESFEKGEKIGFAGLCSPGKQSFFSVREGVKKIFSQEFLCPLSGGYSVSLQTSFLDPAGIWTATLWSENESAEKKIEVSDTREARFLLVRFLSPTGTSFYRGETLALNVEVRDEGNEAGDANAVFWGVDGTRFFLEKTGTGNYFLRYRLPLDSNTGEWKLEVLAQRETENGLIGGKGTIAAEIISAPISIEVIGPDVSYFDVGQKVLFDLVAKYLDGTPLEQGTVTVSVGANTVQLKDGLNGKFSGEFELKQYNIGSVEAVITASDPFGNEQAKTVNLVAGCSPTCLLSQYGLIALGLILAAFVVGRFVLRRTNYASELKKLKLEKEKTLQLIQSLQKEYFSKGVMPAASYKENLAKYRSKTVEIDEKIKNLQKEKENA